MTETIEQITERAKCDAESIVDDLPESLTAQGQMWNDGFETGYVQGIIAEATRDRWIKVEDALPPIHEEPFTEDGFVLILFEHDGWPGKMKTMKASRTIGDWSEDGSPLWFWTDEKGEIIDDDDNLITRWMPILLPTSPTP